MAKNNYLIQQEKRMKRLEQKVEITSAYVGAGLVIAMKELNYSDDNIADIMERTNSIWTKLAEEGINPFKYCLEKTGFEVCPESEAKRINEYFEG